MADTYGRSFRESLTKYFETRTRDFENVCICRGMEIARASVQEEKFREVLLSSVCDYIEAKQGNLSELNVC